MKTPSITFACRRIRAFIRFPLAFLIPVIFLLPPEVTAQDEIMPGVAPVLIPQAGLAIDGDLLARTPVDGVTFFSSTGDFLQNPSATGTGEGVFTNPEGIPLDDATSFHETDGWGNQGVNKDLSVFTMGSKFNDDPNTWHWSESFGPPDKDDINHALLHFGTNSLGQTWFMACADRFAVNGDSYIDFELLQNSLYKNDDGTFTSNGPDGGRTVGDLAITLEFSNGGVDATVICYHWVSVGGGEFDWEECYPGEGVAYASANINSEIDVPFGAFGSTTYEVNAFAEIAVDLNIAIPGLFNNCMGIATVLIKTKASDELNAMLKDLMDPIQVDLGTRPIVEVNSESICEGESATLTATVTFPETGTWSYEWSNGATNSSITVSPTVTTDYFVIVTDEFDCVSEPDTATVTVFPNPVCEITSEVLEPVCPGSSDEFAGPTGDYDYLWSIEGNGTISGPDDEQSVTVIAGSSCNVSYTLTLLLTGENGCDSECDVEIDVNDTEPPVLANLPSGGDLGCNPTPPSCDEGVTATDDCEGDVDVTCTPGLIEENGCLRSQTFTYYAEDGCDNSDSEEITYTWKVDLADPVFTGCPYGPIDLGCNLELLPDCDGAVALVTVNDVCDGPITPTCSAGTVEEDGCYRSQTFTLTAIDECLNDATCQVTYEWKVDLADPVFTGCPSGPIDLGCNPALPVCTDALGLVSVSDLCDGPLTPSCSAGTVAEDGCYRSQTFTLTAVDECLNDATCEVTYEWKVDLTDPEFTGCPSGPIDLGCNPTDLPECADALGLVTVSDVCDGPITPTCSAGTVEEDGCYRSQTFTLTATDECLNVATCDVTYEWKVDITPPVLLNVPDGGDLGCNPDPIPACDPAVSAEDACDGVMAVECSVGPILIAGEYRSQTFTYSAEDICGNPVSESAVYTWYLQDPPILLNVPDGGNLGCNASGPPVVTAVEAYDDDGNPLTVTAEPGLISQDLCNVTQSMIYSATDDCNSTTSQAVTYTWKIDETPPDLFNVPDDIDVLCGEPFEILLPDALDYCDGAVTVLFERSDGGDWDDPYVAGTTTQISFWAMDECLNKSDTVTIDLTIESCGDEYCTLTQGAYGSEGGYYCDGSSTEYLIDSLLAEGDLVLGYNNNTMTFHPGDAVCVMNLLPGGGPAKKINGSNDCTGYGGIQIKLGRINNVLLAQLITLGLNLRLSPDLAYLPIYSDTLWTIASVGCGEPNDTVAGTGQRYILPYPVYMLLSENGTIIPTVEDLYNLANLGLGGEPVGVSLADLAFAADVINVGFDECRFGYFIEVPLEQRSPATPVDVTKMDQVKFNIYPNPFNTEANISFSVPESGQVSVDIYTLTGVRIQTLFNRNAEAGMVYLTKFSGQTGTNQGTYICVISTEYGTKYQRVMMIR